MSCIVKKGILDDAGGLEALAVYLAEDFFMGKTILDRSAMQNYMIPRSCCSYIFACLQNPFVLSVGRHFKHLHSACIECYYARGSIVKIRYKHFLYM